MTEIVLGSGFLGQSGERLREHFAHKSLAVLVDNLTYEAAGSVLLSSLPSSVRLIQLGKSPKADKSVADSIAQQLQGAEALIVVGSGTLNDLGKYAAFSLDIPYAVVATAPSMNGYVSPTASLRVGAHKTSLAARAPELLIADIDILLRAPSRLIHSGFADVICRSTIQADWLLAHYLLDVPYDASLFTELQALEHEIIPRIAGIIERDASTMELLMRMLITSGAAMAKAKSSMPASQGEHMIAHTLEMLYGHFSHGAYHGEEIAVTGLSMARLQEKLLLKQPVIRSNIKTLERFEQLFSKELAPTLYEIYQHKNIHEEKADALNAKLDKQWPDIAAKIRSVHIGASAYERLLRQAHCPVSYTDIHWNKDRYEHALSHAHLTRERFTFLDIAAMNPQMRYWFG